MKTNSAMNSPVRILSAAIILILIFCLTPSQNRTASAFTGEIGTPAVFKNKTVQDNQSSTNDLFYIKGTEGYLESDQVLNRVNQERQAAGGKALVMDPELQAAAMQRAAEIALYFSHTRPDGTICSSISQKVYGENIAIGYTSAKTVMDGWMSSPGHRDNILDGGYQSIGIGYFWQDTTRCWVQLFGYEADGTAINQPDKTVTRQVLAKPGTFKIHLSKELQTTMLKGQTATLDPYVPNPQSWVTTQLEPQTFRWSSDGDAVSVNEEGMITAEKEGSATVKGELPVSGQSVSQEITVPAAPEKATINSVKAGKASLTVTWKRDTEASGYQVIAAQNSQFTKGKKTATIAGNKTTSKTITKLAKKKTYYVKVRAYKQVDRTKLYGAYSPVKKVKTK